MPELIKFILFLIAGYFFGSIPIAYLVVKWRYGADIRKYGSGGIGGSNVYRSFSKPLGVMVGIFDAGKGAFFVWLAHLAGMGTGMEIAIGIAVIAGHNWSIFMGFNSGRGLATTLGIAAYIFPWGIWVFIAGAALTLLLGSSPLPVLIGTAALPLASWLHGEPELITFGLLVLFLLLVLRRISAPLSERSRTVSTRELLLNRLLFDRDIRDGKSWITFKPLIIQKIKKQGKS